MIDLFEKKSANINVVPLIGFTINPLSTSKTIALNSKEIENIIENTNSKVVLYQRTNILKQVCCIWQLNNSFTLLLLLTLSKTNSQLLF
jgi:isocitrate dehydrogenase